MKVLTILDGQSLLALANIAKQLERLADAWEGKKTEPSPAPAPVEVEPELLQFETEEPAPAPKPKQTRNRTKLPETLATEPRKLRPNQSKREPLENYVSASYVFPRVFGKGAKAEYRGQHTSLLLVAIQATGARNGYHKRHRFIHRDDVQAVIDWMNAHREQ